MIAIHGLGTKHRPEQRRLIRSRRQTQRLVAGSFRRLELGAFVITVGLAGWWLPRRARSVALRLVAALCAVAAWRRLAWWPIAAAVAVIIGAKTPEQLEDNLAAAKLELTAEEVGRLDEVSALPREYPGWMIDFQGSEREPKPFTP